MTFDRNAFQPYAMRPPYFGERTSQLYFAGGEYLDSDVANAVRDELVIAAEVVEDPDRIARHGLAGPFIDARYDFALTPAAAAPAA
jgi:catechol 1,2-dioxygenase